MNEKEISEYLVNYIENDKTRSAVMLTGPWGSGKSYYIQNQLVNMLEKNDKDIVCVSLYGLKTLAELNKSIYLELRAKKVIKNINKKLSKNQVDIDSTNKSKKHIIFGRWVKKHGNELTISAYLLGKTIIKGFAGFFNVPLEFSDKDIEKLFSSINLEGKLIVLEDLERSSIDIIEVMGYVNNLVEQDGVKVLLVANEDEIIKYVEDTEDGKEKDDKKSKKLTDKASEYVRVKEKTVRDTICFEPNYNFAVLNIIKEFQCKYFEKAIDEDQKTKLCPIVSNTVKIMDDLKIYNLRAVLYACQKTSEIFNKTELEYNLKFFRFVYSGIVAFALRLSENSDLRWESETISPAKLGTREFPLYKVIYNYVKLHYFDKSAIIKAANAYKLQSNTDIKLQEVQEAVSVLSSAFFMTEEEVNSAVKVICKHLDSKGIIPYIDYGKLANYLISVRHIMNEDSIIDSCKEKMLNNLNKEVLDDGQILSLQMYDGILLWTDAQNKEYNDFASKMVEAAKKIYYNSIGNFNDAKDVDTLIDSVITKRGQSYSYRDFIRKINIESLITVLPNCTSCQIYKLRAIFLDIYRSVNIADFFSEDKESLILLRDGILNLIKSTIVKDKIKIQQLRWFENNLNEIIERL